jgi:hypothetical protein
MQKILEFWKTSLHSDPKAFVLEMISFAVTIVASFMMAFTADRPDMRVIYPIFFVGSLCGCWAYYRRQIAWPMLLTGYFCVMNVFGFGRAILWW